MIFFRQQIETCSFTYMLFYFSLRQLRDIKEIKQLLKSTKNFQIFGTVLSITNSAFIFVKKKANGIPFSTK